jgi:Fe-S cluster assembly iron-binding protein IscA
MKDSQARAAALAFGFWIALALACVAAVALAGHFIGLFRAMQMDAPSLFEAGAALLAGDALAWSVALAPVVLSTAAFVLGARGRRAAVLYAVGAGLAALFLVVSVASTAGNVARFRAALEPPLEVHLTPAAHARAKAYLEDTDHTALRIEIDAAGQLELDADRRREGDAACTQDGVSIVASAELGSVLSGLTIDWATENGCKGFKLGGTAPALDRAVARAARSRGSR